jgi:glycosyltransferase involved in cell wall biosynthesis
MKITIITVCYNSATTIRDTFESVLNQTCSEIDYVVIDGNSKDETVSIIKEYEKKFNGRMRWISEPDNGLYDAMNKGIQMAKGEIIGILNSDDYYASNNVLELVAKTFSEENVDSCYGNLLYIKNEKPYRLWKSGKRKSFKLGWMPPHPCFFVKKAIYEKLGYYRLDCGSAADYELMLRFFEKENITTQWVNELLIIMRIGGISNSSIISRIKAYKDDKKGWVVNDLTPLFLTLFMKKIFKIPQYFQAMNISKKLPLMEYQ